MDVKLTVRGGVSLDDMRPRDKVSALVGLGQESAGTRGLPFRQEEEK